LNRQDAKNAKREEKGSNQDTFSSLSFLGVLGALAVHFIIHRDIAFLLREYLEELLCFLIVS